MKNLFLVLLIFPLCGYAQKNELKTFLISGGMVFFSGVNEGINHTLIYKYGNFKKVHPNANDLFWNPDISWKNKYKDWDGGDTRAKFPGSKSIFVSVTDADHLTKSLARWPAYAGFSYNFLMAEKGKKWYEYVGEGTLLYAVQRLGFNFSYKLIYKG